MSAPDRIILSVRLASGEFDTSVSVETTASADERQSAVMRWLELVMMGLRLKVEDMRVDLAAKVSP